MSKLDTSTSLPASWNFVPLKELGNWSGGGTPSKAKAQYWQGGTIPWVSPKDMKTERISDSEDHITEEAVSHSTTSLINAGSVLIVTRSGILRHTLPVAVNSVSVTVNQDLKALTPRNDILAEYVAWALRAFSRDILHTCSKQGTTVNSVETSKLLGFEIPVAPRGQQVKIVAEIEKQFSRLDEAVANLKRVKANLKRYKAAVLKAAVEGKLTEDWRKQHPNVEPASKLLERILAERRMKWIGRGKYKEPVKPDTSNLPPLPKYWTYAPVDSFIIEPMCNGISVKGSMTSPGVPALRLNAMTETGFDYSKVRYIPIDAALAKELEVKTADFFVSRGNGSLRLVGRGTVAQTPPRQCVFPDTMIRLRIAVAIRTSRWISVIWSGELIRRQIEQKVKTTAGIWKISQPELGSILLPVPSEAEQHHIVAEVERSLSVIEELEAAVEGNIIRADRLRQSVLARAFSGELTTLQ